MDICTHLMHTILIKQNNFGDADTKMIVDLTSRIYTSTEKSKVLKILNDHYHDSEAALIEANVAITNMKQRAKDTLEPTSSVINECTSGISQAAKGALAADGAIKNKSGEYVVNYKQPRMHQKT